MNNLWILIKHAQDGGVLRQFHYVALLTLTRY